MPNPIDIRHRVQDAMRDMELSSNPVATLMTKAAQANTAHEARDFANAALTVAQAIGQQQFNKPKRKVKR